ncbi:hypothetical protein GBSOP10_101510 [Armatimonadetes bacterium GBS]|nr:MAG: hypothetical protein KatS3mg021_0329 [Fimbriimonadales bacterium]CUU02159.1 hypothetical protein GBSOP10_101510 [Armatimonadetes bacterium GBS]CUU36392.1 hypothetical protein GXSOP10_12371 [Armatimonadetes bacterium GXS]
MGFQGFIRYRPLNEVSFLQVSVMGLRGVIRGRIIQLVQEPPLPDGTQVEVELISLPRSENPLWDRLREHAKLLTED